MQIWIRNFLSILITVCKYSIYKYGDNEKCYYIRVEEKHLKVDMEVFGPGT